MFVSLGTFGHLEGTLFHLSVTKGKHPCDFVIFWIIDDETALECQHPS